MTADWRQLFADPAGERHLVQVYQERGFLVRAVAEWIGAAIAKGGGGILVGSPENVDDVLRQAERNGIDIARPRREGRLLVVDGNEMLAAFMVDGEPDATLFKPLARELFGRVRDACPPDADIRAWGEMVNTLALAGQPRAAERLEAIWNDVVDEQRIRLLCSYELDHLSPDSHGGALRSACVGHSQLIPEEDYDALEEAVDAALTAEYGEGEAAHLRASLGPQRPLPIGMPTSESVLVGLHRVDPARAARVFNNARASLRAGYSAH